MELCGFLTLIQICICLMMGLFFGSMLMFYWNYKEIKNLQQDLGNCILKLDSYESN